MVLYRLLKRKEEKKSSQDMFQSSMTIENNSLKKKKTMARKADVAAQKARPHEFGQDERCDNKARMRGILI